MALPLTKSQIEKLGARLVGVAQPEPDDLAALHELLAAYDEVLARATVTVRDRLGVAPTARIKNTGTILEKLERYGGSWLKSIQDLAGMRIVGDFDRDGQDALVGRLVDLFADAPRAAKIVDRREEPVQGYRAVHVIVFPEGIPVEVQVRTRIQHEWAETFEKLADRIGRDIRYGEPPAPLIAEDERGRLSADERALYDAGYEMRVTSVRWAIAVADLIDVVERGEMIAPAEPFLIEARENAAERIAQLRNAVNTLS